MGIAFNNNSSNNKRSINNEPSFFDCSFSGSTSNGFHSWPRTNNNNNIPSFGPTGSSISNNILIHQMYIARMQKLNDSMQKSKDSREFLSLYENQMLDEYNKNKSIRKNITTNRAA